MRRSRLVTLIGQDLDAQGRAVEHGSVLVPVQQGLPDQAADHCPELPLGPRRGLGPPLQIVLRLRVTADLRDG